MTKVTTASLKSGLDKIVQMINTLDTSACSGEEAIDKLIEVRDLAETILNPVSGPSLMDLKITEVTGFIMNNFSLAFAINDEVREALNTAGITSSTGKAWTRPNMAKVMVGVRAAIVKSMSDANAARVNDDAGAERAAEAEQIDPATDVTPEVEETPYAAPEKAEDASEITLMAELDDLDDLNVEGLAA